MIGNCFCMTLPSHRTNEEVAVEAVTAFAKLLDPAQDELGDIRNSVSEAFRNCVDFAYPGKVGEVSIRCQVLKYNVLSIVIKDKGKGIEDINQAQKPMFTTGGTDHSGMGLVIMEAFMDECKVTSIPNGGTTVRLKKKIKS